MIDGKEPSFGLAYATLPVATASSAVCHRTTVEKRYCVAGEGEFWIKIGADERVIPLVPGKIVTIPTGASFQFQNTGSSPLKVLIASTALQKLVKACQT